MSAKLSAMLHRHGLQEYRQDPIHIPRPRPSSVSLAGPSPAPSSNIGYSVGLAKLIPSTSYPTIVPVKTEETVRVRHLVSHGIPPGDDSPSAFLRLAQIVALDCTRQASEHKNWGMDKEVLAWWEDADGMWLITRPEAEWDSGTVVLGAYWKQEVGLPAEETDNGDEDVVMGEGVSTGAVGHRGYERAAEVLIEIAKCIHELHRVGLTLAVLDPDSFVVRQEPTLTVGIRHLSEAFVNARTGSISPTHPPALSQTLFSSTALPASTRPLTDDFIRSHIRSLSPKAISGREAGVADDVYAFGAMAYELLVGVPIDGLPEGEDIDLLSDIQAHLNRILPCPSESLGRSSETDGISAAVDAVVMRCLARDERERYRNFQSVIYDLAKILALHREDVQLSTLVVGEIDQQSGFEYPSLPIARESQLAALDQHLSEVRKDGSDGRYRYVDLWGSSGSGKTTLARTWASDSHRNDCLVAYAKLDEQVQKPLACFIQLFRSLLYQLLADPQEDAREWAQVIRTTLGPHFSVFYFMLPNDVQKLLLLGAEAPGLQAIDWSAFIPSFKLWCKRLMQRFATPKRPLILLLDDVQWMHKEEHTIWRDILSEGRPLLNVLVLSLNRVDGVEPPVDSQLLSLTCFHVEVPFLDEPAVGRIIQRSFGAPIDQEDTLYGLLYAETRGNPLYLRALLSRLTECEAISFDYSTTLWRINLDALYTYMVKQDVDGYLEGLHRRLPQDAQDLLSLLSCLPQRISPSVICSVSGIDENAFEEHIASARASGIIATGDRGVEFTHDRQRKAAYRLIPKHLVAETHFKAYNALRQPHLLDEYAFDAAEHAMKSRSLNGPTGDAEELTRVLLEAVHLCTFSAGFNAAKELLGTVREIVDGQDGCEQWLERYPDSFIRYLSLQMEVCIALKQYDESFSELYWALPRFDRTDYELQCETLIIRLLIAAGKSDEGIQRFNAMLDKSGYNPQNPKAVKLISINSVDRMQALSDAMLAAEMCADIKRVNIRIMGLIGYVTPTVYAKSDMATKTALFKLSISVLADLGCPLEVTSSIVALGVQTVSDVRIKQILLHLAEKLAHLFPASYFTPFALTSIASESHCLQPLSVVMERQTRAMTSAVSMVNYDIAAWAFLLKCGTLCFSSMRVPLVTLRDEYEAIVGFASRQTQVVMEIGLECYSRLCSTSDEPEPWVLPSAQQLGEFPCVPLYTGATRALQLRLAMLYDAPPDVVKSIIGTADANDISHLGDTIWGCEWAFLTSLYDLQPGQPTTGENSYSRMSASFEGADFAYRREILAVLGNVVRTGTSDISDLDKLIDRLDEAKHHDISGILNSLIAKHIHRITGSTKAANAYWRAASAAYRSAGFLGPSANLERLYFAPAAQPDLDMAEQRMSAPTSPALSAKRARSISANEANSSDSLDARTLFRSTIALTAEKDPAKLLCTLLKMLCQFARADFAAIAVQDATCKSGLRLRAGGLYDDIEPSFLDFADEGIGKVVPSNIMLQVARTGEGIVESSPQKITVHDTFYADRLPCMLICLPTFSQGQQAGVILLSCMTSSSIFIEAQSARDVISCLATFAHNIDDQQSFTRRLKDEVDQRTSQLSHSLQVKSFFLSSCSHELRSPLSAVLGLAAVLEASEGLSEVQMEHLRTIISSGEHLLELINNILDYSRLESNSVALEDIPFDLREIVETAIESMATIAHSKDIDLVLASSINTDPPRLIGDPTRIRQILINLMSNAIKFTSEGYVSIEWRTEQLGESGDNVMVWLDIKDTGIGIPAGKMDQLFQSFSQIDSSITRSYGGSGLGLVISRELARLLGGDCTAVSDHGQGSTFTFSFTTRVEKTDAPSRPALPAKNCMVICSPGPARDVLAQNLNDLGFVVVTTTPAASTIPDGRPNGHHVQPSTIERVFLEVVTLDSEEVATIQMEYPAAIVTLLCPNIHVSQTMKRLNVSRKELLSQPFRFHDLYQILEREEVANGTPPFPDPPSSRKRKRVADKELAQRCPQKILVIDDNRINLTVAKRILEMFGYTDVDTADNARLGIEKAEKQRYGLILMDLFMPKLDGFSALKELQGSEKTGHPVVVALTADALGDTRRRCEEAGFLDCLLKPLDIAQLGGLLETVYNRRKPNGKNI